MIRSLTLPFAAAATLAIGAVAPAAAQDEGMPDILVAETDELGPYLLGPGGLPVYYFRTTGIGGDDLPPIESCLDPCREEWPLVEVGDEVTYGTGVDDELIGVRDDGDVRVMTYESRVLFSYAQDEPMQPPQGQAESSYGGWWLLVRPDGSSVMEGVPDGAFD
ncbi:hypothetical protein ACXN5S_19545 [Pseudoroseicyclus sp. H15]